MPKLEVFRLALLGGLQQSKPIPDPTDLQVLDNMVPFRGRFALRSPLAETVSLLSLAADGTPTAINQVLAGKYHAGFFYVVGYYANSINKTYLYKLNVDGTAIGGGATTEPVATVWSGATVPQVNMVSFQGGTAIVNADRLYIADYSETYDTVLWNGTTIDSTTDAVKVDLNDDNTKESLRFGLVFAYQYHLWGTGFFQGGASRRVETLRFSRPGLISETEPSVVYNANREWWSVDLRPVGTRGVKITAAGVAGTNLIIGKSNALYALYGYDASSWASKQLSDKLGIVGYRAFCATEAGLGFGWSSRGPFVTDGNDVQDLSAPIRRKLQEIGFTTDTVMEYSPDDGVVYTVVPATGGGSPDLYIALDAQSGKLIEAAHFSTGGWLKTGGGALRANALAAVVDNTLSGPLAAPSSLAGTAVSESEIDLTWTNGDTAVETQTEVHRGTSSGFTVGAGTLIALLNSGVASYANTAGLSAKTTYYYKLRHLRNAVYSSNSNEASAKTWLQRPSNFTASSLITGVHVALTNNEANADVVIERKPSGGGYTLLVTKTNQAAGAVTHDDTTGSCGVTYFYRSYVTKSGETTSAYSNESSQLACAPPPDITSASHSAKVLGECPSYQNVAIRWAGTSFDALDTVVLSQQVDAGAFVYRATVALIAGSYNDVWGRKSGGVAQTLTYKLEAYDGGTVLVDTFTTTPTDHLVDASPCPE